MTTTRRANLAMRKFYMKRSEGLDRDTWIATHSPISPQKLHALGYVNFVWNGCQHDLNSLFAATMRIPEREAWVLIHDLGYIAICTRIIEMAKYRDLSDAYRILLKNAIDVYDICRINRNQLTHFSIAAANRPELSLHRISKKPGDRNTQKIADELWDMRRVGRDINRLRQRIRALWFAQDFLDYNPALPPVLRVPEPIWKAPPLAPKVRKLRPQSSRPPA